MSTPASAKRLFIPFEGTYIAFTFDLHGTFEYHKCSLDAVARREIESFPRRTYVGYVSYSDELSEFPRRDKDFNKVLIAPLQTSLTHPMPEWNITADMCAPVYPETCHPDNRPPLQTNNPLPWSGTYHPTCLTVPALLPRQWDDYSAAYSINSMDLCRMILYGGDDSDKRRGVVYEESESDLVSEGEAALAELYEREWARTNDLDEFLPQHSRRMTRPSSSCSSEDNEDLEGDEYGSVVTNEDAYYSAEDDNFSLFSGERSASPGDKQSLDGSRPSTDKADDVKDPGPRCPVLKFTTDLSNVEALHSALELDTDFDHLQRLIKDCFERAETAPEEVATPTMDTDDENEPARGDSSTAERSRAWQTKGFLRIPRKAFRKVTKKLSKLLHFPRRIHFAFRSSK